MRKLFVLTALAVATVAGVYAQSDGDYQGYMKTVQGTVGSLRKNIDGKMNDMAASDAQKLADTFKQVEAYWTKRGGADDAVNFARQAGAAAGAAAKAASAGNMEQAAAEMKNMQSNCGGCHTAHREKAPEGFKIK